MVKKHNPITFVHFAWLIAYLSLAGWPAGMGLLAIPGKMFVNNIDIHQFFSTWHVLFAGWIKGVIPTAVVGGIIVLCGLRRGVKGFLLSGLIALVFSLFFLPRSIVAVPAADRSLFSILSVFFLFYGTLLLAPLLPKKELSADKRITRRHGLWLLVYIALCSWVVGAGMIAPDGQPGHNGDFAMLTIIGGGMMGFAVALLTGIIIVFRGLRSGRHNVMPIVITAFSVYVSLACHVSLACVFIFGTGAIGAVNETWAALALMLGWVVVHIAVTLLFSLLLPEAEDEKISHE